MFEGFAEETIDTGGARIFARHGGEGPAVLLLHGHPRTSATWHRAAPLLVEAGFTVVCADLRGYGRSVGPAPAADHRPHSKRAVALDMVRVMSHLGHECFAVMGHDRGSYVAFRLALDHPDRVIALGVFDGVPLTEHLDRGGTRFVLRWWHWFFFAQPEIPERVIGRDPDAWYQSRHHGDPAIMGEENHAEWRAATHRPEVIRAMLEDYRAGVTVDAELERADRAAGRRLTMPVLSLWSQRDDLEELVGDPREIWREWADVVEGRAIDSGHHMAEEAPEEVAAAVTGFLDRAIGRGAEPGSLHGSVS
ncbi:MULTISPECIES: alpha/beta hydrolase [Microbacterium]|uniref:alpha/beta hydrolase n=1 Tax=Microbacterium TaxID=33882 RepID=UPI00217D1227|nr:MULTISPECIES: alpha/beta hydrolase [Microbacterium]UWF77773.1 alpha/beta fold hydrolase [Microbacterium neungamense]WCM55951.1 alpha/beta fold hydrolase [Microbacterium sp. EF45047]